MNADQRIVVGVDGLDFSTTALRLEESRDAQLLMVGRRGRGGFLEQVMGSVSGACVAHAGCPVLVVGDRSGKQQPGG